MKEQSTQWHLKIEDPSGHTRTVSVRGKAELIRGPALKNQIEIRDPTLPQNIGEIWALEGSTDLGGSPFWIRVQPDAPALKLAGLEVRESHLPEELAFKIGETKLRLSKTKKSLDLPEQPNHIPNWQTSTEEGRTVLWTARKVAETPLAIYLKGKTGTGKEVLAHLIHAWSGKGTAPFVALNCGALSLSLVESELFGHVKGAYTGAEKSRPGALLQAHGGTLFLDEVADLPLDIQVKLLRFLENGEIRPVGADRCVHSQVRLICATHQDLEERVRQGKFRQDLYYRVASVTIEIPDLKDRPDDIALLAKKYASTLQRSLTEKAVQRLQMYDWPGNVRELRHGIERAVGMAGPFVQTLDESDFSFLTKCELLALRDNLGKSSTPLLPVREMERVLVLRSLQISKGNRTVAAKILGVARSTFFEMLKRNHIMGPRSEHRTFEKLKVA